MTKPRHLVCEKVAIVVSALVLLIAPLVVSAQSDDEAAVKHHVERFLTAMGEGNLDALPDMFVAEANIATAWIDNGSWVTSTVSFEDWMTSLRDRATWNRFSEPVSEYTVYVEDSIMAFVRADTTLIREGRARSRNIDYFTLVRVEGAWKFLSASYVARPVESE